MRRIALLAIASIVLLLTACATTTETHSTWQTKTGESHPTFRHMYVLVLADDPAVAATAEQQVRKSLNHRAVEATLASETLGERESEREAYRAQVEAAVKASGADGVMVVSLLKVEERSEYVPPQVDYVPVPSAPMYLGYGPYVGHSYGAIYQPGYYHNAKDYYLQTQVYSVERKRPVWQAQSRSMNPDSLKNGAKGYAKSIVSQLDKDGALKR